jgi:hypothetical protein
VIVVDGLWGVGKTAVTSVIGAMKNVEKVKLDLVHEYACVLRSLGKIDDDACDFLNQTYADLNQYHNLIGREVNFRPSDATSTRNTPGSTLRYLKRMFVDAGDQIINEINDKNIAYHLVSHQVLPVAGPLFEIYGDRLKMVHVVRHPVHLARYWNDYLRDSLRHREFTVSFDVRGQKVPWWAAGWAEDFIEMNVMDRALSSISHLYDLLINRFEQHRGDPRLLVISFEDVVMRPQSTFPRIAEFLGRDLSRKTDKILSRERIPRPTITHGRAFSAHNWATDGDVTEQQVYEMEMNYVTESASPTVLARFRDTIRRYDELWPSELNEFADAH